MSQQTDATLKSYFQAGDQPTQQDFADLIDSKLNVADYNQPAAAEINVKDAGYNAQGDGITDDVAAFLQANSDLAALGGGTIYVPVGAFRIADDIAFDDSVQLRLENGATLAPASAVALTNVRLVSPPQATLFAGNGTVTLASGARYDVRWWGATGDGSTDDYAALTRARAALEAAGGGDLYFASGEYKSGTDLAYASTVRLVLANGAVLAPTTGKSVTINGTLSAPSATIFGGAGTVQLAKGQRANVSWWGAAPDGATSAVAAFAAAAASGSSSVVVPPGADTYLLDDDVTVGTGVELWIEFGAQVEIASGKVLTLNGPVWSVASPFWTGDGSVVFGPASYISVPDKFGIGAPASARFPFNTLQVIQGADVGTSGTDIIGFNLSTRFAGDFAEMGGPDPGSVWGTQSFTMAGHGADDGDGITYLYGGLFTSVISGGATIPYVIGLAGSTAVFGATASGTIQNAYSIMAISPDVVEGATGHIQNAISLYVAKPTAGENSNFSLFVAGGESRFQNPEFVTSINVIGTTPESTNSPNLSFSDIANGRVHLRKQGTALAVVSDSLGAFALLYGDTGNIDLANGVLSKSGTPVVGARRTGWTDQTATAARTDLGSSPEVGALASAFRALYDDLKAHGLIGN